VSGGVAAVQARIAEIRASVAPVATTVTATTATTAATAAVPGATASSVAGTDFAAALAQLTGATGAGAAGADPATVPSRALSTSVTGQDLVAAARAYLGTPYVWGGESLDEGGLDCSGLVLRSLADLGITSGVPRVARDQATLGEAVGSLDQALPGDLIVLGGGSHIGIYVGDGQMIDAPKPGRSVTVRDVYAEPTAIRRILPQQAAGATTTAPASLTSSALSSALASTTAGQNALALLTGGTGSAGSTGTSTTSSLLTSLWGSAS